MGNIQNKAQRASRKIWGKENGGSFGLVRQSLGSGIGTKTWS